jgi:hypothetical protein
MIDDFAPLLARPRRPRWPGSTPATIFSFASYLQAAARMGIWGAIRDIGTTTASLFRESGFPRIPLTATWRLSLL